MARTCHAARCCEETAGHWSTRIGALLSIGTAGDDHDDRPDQGPVELSAEATVLRMLLGAQLRRLREAADISAEKAGYEIRASRSKISRIETGRVGL